MQDKNAFTNAVSTGEELEQFPLTGNRSRKLKAKSSVPTSEDASASDFVRQAVLRRLAEIVADSLGVEVEDVDTGTALRFFGMDGLTALHLVLKIEQELGTPVPPAALLDGSTIHHLADRILLSKQ